MDDQILEVMSTINLADPFDGTPWFDKSTRDFIALLSQPSQLTDATPAASSIAVGTDQEFGTMGDIPMATGVAQTPATVAVSWSSLASGTNQDEFRAMNDDPMASSVAQTPATVAVSWPSLAAGTDENEFRTMNDDPMASSVAQTPATVAASWSSIASGTNQNDFPHHFIHVRGDGVQHHVYGKQAHQSCKCDRCGRLNVGFVFLCETCGCQTCEPCSGLGPLYHVACPPPKAVLGANAPAVMETFLDELERMFRPEEAQKLRERREAWRRQNGSADETPRPQTPPAESHHGTNNTPMSFSSPTPVINGQTPFSPAPTPSEARPDEVVLKATQSPQGHVPPPEYSSIANPQQPITLPSFQELNASLMRDIPQDANTAETCSQCVMGTPLCCCAEYCCVGAEAGAQPVAPGNGSFVEPQTGHQQSVRGKLDELAFIASVNPPLFEKIFAFLQETRSQDEDAARDFRALHHTIPSEQPIMSDSQGHASMYPVSNDGPDPRPSDAYGSSGYGQPPFSLG